MENDAKLSPRWWLVGSILFLLVAVAGYVLWHNYHQGAKDNRLSRSEIAEAIAILKSDSSKSDLDRKKNAIDYVMKKMKPISHAEEDSVRSELMSYSVDKLQLKLDAIYIRTQSYFWLSGDEKYIEVIFWTIFGVLASVLYFSSEAMRGLEFRKEEFYVYVAKVFYAPLISLVIVFSYSLLTASNDVKYDSTSVELLAISFVLGFFSGRAIELLNRLKEVILPAGKSPSSEKQITLTGKIVIPPEATDIDPSKIEVTLASSANPTQKNQVVADVNGRYTFTGIKEGIYDISALAQGKSKAYTASVPKRKLSNDKPDDVENLTLS
ncbi:MAG TPA: carboxypeptidase-like regulatory domain-containing protein [Bacteroidota bacterium]|nr:carboxypeptidase-like regulatory domain-containing protein [Bacteroidota bacterium]